MPIIHEVLGQEPELFTRDKKIVFTNGREEVIYKSFSNNRGTVVEVVRPAGPDREPAYFYRRLVHLKDVNGRFTVADPYGNDTMLHTFRLG